VKPIPKPSDEGLGAVVRLSVAGDWLRHWETKIPHRHPSALAAGLQSDLLDVLGVAAFRIRVPVSGLVFCGAPLEQAAAGRTTVGQGCAGDDDDGDSDDVLVVVELQGQEVGSAVTLETSSDLVQRLAVAMSQCSAATVGSQTCPPGRGLFDPSREFSRYLQPARFEVDFQQPASISLSTQRVSFTDDLSSRGQHGYNRSTSVTVSNGGGQTLVIS